MGSIGQVVWENGIEMQVEENSRPAGLTSTKLVREVGGFLG